MRGAALYTTTITVNAIGNPEQIVTHTECDSVTVKEDPSVSNWPTVDYKIIGSVPGSTAIQCPAGTEYLFEAGPGQHFYSGEVIGYIETVTGSSTFQQKENRR